ncbi:hypothetical protein [uncultured Thiodictyon sp.]|uniref:hypothetical protein n=1 Tax=uncultured Thiodictyon sp. TaxID=1846217 RepID=UPI0025D5F078|nr:hypothetical protein [uncultured Thiodictyon sp.]
MSPKREDGEALRRFSVKVPDAYPELLADLMALPSRARPERLRTLALIGLMALRGGVASHAPAQAAALPLDAGLQEQRLRLLSAIGSGE